MDFRMSSEASAALAQITPSKVVLFSTAWCGYCAQVKALLVEFQRQRIGFRAFEQPFDQVMEFAIDLRPAFALRAEMFAQIK